MDLFVRPVFTASVQQPPVCRLWVTRDVLLEPDGLKFAPGILDDLLGLDELPDRAFVEAIRHFRVGNDLPRANGHKKSRVLLLPVIDRRLADSEEICQFLVGRPKQA